MPIQLGDITAKIIVYEEDLRSVQHRDKLCLIKPQTSIFLKLKQFIYNILIVIHTRISRRFMQKY